MRHQEINENNYSPSHPENASVFGDQRALVGQGDPLQGALKPPLGEYGTIVRKLG